MSESEVFRPMNGPLLVRGNIAHGLPQRSDTLPFRRTESAGGGKSNPGGYRFGQLSMNSFFARHNPHPHRVRHMKGLLDVPICTVSDDGFMSNPRYSLTFPPNNFDQTRLKSYSKYYNLPVNCINVNSQQHPINTITGLQWFMGKPLNLRFHREKAIPKMGMVPVTEAWRDELKALTEAVGLPVIDTNNKKENGVTERRNTASDRRSTAGDRRGTAGERRGTADSRPRTQYSQTTGRLIPPPSRAMSRGCSRQSRRDQAMGQLQHIMGEPDTENVVLQMLCQVLQSDDINAVQSWLVSAGDREKAMVLDMIRAALVSNEEYYKQHDVEYVPDRPKTSPSVIGEQGFLPERRPGTSDEDVEKAIDRLTLDPVTPPRPPSEPNEEDNLFRLAYTPTGNRQASPKTDLQCIDDLLRPVTADVFRPSKSRQSDRPRSGLARAKTPNKPATPSIQTSEARLRYTTTPIMDQDISSQKQSLKETLGEEDQTWQQDVSTIG